MFNLAGEVSDLDFRQVEQREDAAVHFGVGA